MSVNGGLELERFQGLSETGECFQRNIAPWICKASSHGSSLGKYGTAWVESGTDRGFKEDGEWRGSRLKVKRSESFGGMGIGGAPGAHWDGEGGAGGWGLVGFPGTVGQSEDLGRMGIGGVSGAQWDEARVSGEWGLEGFPGQSETE